MTIYEIAERTKAKQPYFFSKDTMRFFGQTMSKFRVKKQSGGKYLIYCPMKDRRTGKHIGMTERLFNPETNDLEFID